MKETLYLMCIFTLYLMCIFFSASVGQKNGVYHMYDWFYYQRDKKINLDEFSDTY